MKKTIAALAAVLSVSAMVVSASAAPNVIEDVVSGAGTVVGGVVSGAGDVVDGVVSGVEQAVPGGSTGNVPDISVDSNTNTNAGNSVPNANTGVPAMELVALGTAAVGGLTAMALTVRRKK
jgi:phage-related protein